MSENTTVTNIEEPFFGMSPDELRTAFQKSFARLRRATNGYEVVGLLGWLSKGFIGLDPRPDPWGTIVCYWKRWKIGSDRG